MKSSGDDLGARDRAEAPMSDDLYYLRCAWRRDGDCENTLITVRVEFAGAIGWRLVHCEDGEDRPFCPKHAAMLAMPEEDPAP